MTHFNVDSYQIKIEDEWKKIEMEIDEESEISSRSRSPPRFEFNSEINSKGTQQNSCFRSISHIFLTYRHPRVRFHSVLDKLLWFDSRRNWALY